MITISKHGSRRVSPPPDFRTTISGFCKECKFPIDDHMLIGWPNVWCPWYSGDAVHSGIGFDIDGNPREIPNSVL